MRDAPPASVSGATSGDSRETVSWSGRVTRSPGLDDFTNAMRKSGQAFKGE
jgi:hypothetical protein